MYLVLMAMLALNIDPSALLAFKQVNRGLDNAAAAFDAQNTSVLQAIKTKADDKGENSAAAKFFSQANKAEEISLEGQKLIDGLLKQIEEEAVDQKGEFDFNDKDAGAIVMMTDDIKTGGAAQLKAKLDEVNKKFTELVNETEGLNDEEKKELIDNFPITTEIPADAENTQGYGWEQYTYQGKPAVAILTLLKQAQNDIKTTEGSIIGKFAQKLDIDNLKFDQFKAAVIPSSTYLQKGDTFEAQIFLAASSSQGGSNYSVRVNGQNIAVDSKGVATYKATNGVGEHSINGGITVTNPETGEVTNVPFENPVKYQVAAPSATVSADKMNVFYIGVDNPVSVSAAGVGLNDVTASCSGCQMKKTGPGKYNVRATKQGKVNVSISAKGKNMGSSEFRVKRIPDPTPKIGVLKSGTPVSSGSMAAQSFLQADLENFDFDAKFKVLSYDMWLISPGKSSFRSRGGGSQLPADIKKNLRRVGPGWIVLATNIMAQGPDGSKRNIGSVYYPIK